VTCLSCPHAIASAPVGQKPAAFAEVRAFTPLFRPRGAKLRSVRGRNRNIEAGHDPAAIRRRQKVVLARHGGKRRCWVMSS
jgi:hypothetical protein